MDELQEFIPIATLPRIQGFKRLRSVFTGKSCYEAQNDQVYESFLQKRELGEQVGDDWFKRTMNDVMKKDRPDLVGFDASNGWMHRFLKRYKVSLQQQTEKKAKRDADIIHVFQRFHQDVLNLARSRSEIVETRDPVYGRFSPEQVINTDEVPYRFVSDHRRSYNKIGGKFCHIKTPGDSGDKRSATIVLTLRGAGEQFIKPVIIFHGKGHLSDLFLAQLDEVGIPYYFNEAAWATSEFCLKHVEYMGRILQEKCPEIKEFCLFIDGLGAHLTTKFNRCCQKYNIFPLNFPPNTTHVLQPVDHRVAAWIKSSMNIMFRREEEVMREQWIRYRVNGSLSEHARRVTMLKWINYVWEDLKTRPDFIMRAFLSTGCIINQSGEHAIRIKSIPDYTFDIHSPRCWPVK